MMAACGGKLSAGSGGRRGWLLPVQLLLVAAALLALLTLLLIRVSDHASSSRPDSPCRRRREQMVVLPPEPSDDTEMVARLADYLTLPSSKPCQRELTLGGEPHEFSQKSVAVVGVKSVCLDPGLSLARADCLVVASRRPEESSLDKAAAQFGCEVHSYGPDRGRALPAGLSPLPGGRRPVSLLALYLDAGELADLLQRPPAALRRVEQLTVRLDMTAALQAVAGGDVPLLRRLYSGLRRLQDHGFHPFSSSIVEAENVLDITLRDQQRPISTLSEVAWMKVLCDD